MTQRMGDPTLTETVRARLQELDESGAINMTAVAGLLNRHRTTVYRAIYERAEITIDLLEAVAATAKPADSVRVVELIAPLGAAVKQLDADEAALLRYVRQWPKSVQRALLAFLRYWDDEPETASDARKLREFFRRLRRPIDREAVVLIAQLLAEGILTPDMLEGLVERFQAEKRREKADAEAQRRKDERRKRRNGP